MNPKDIIISLAMLAFGQTLPAQVTISLRDATSTDTIADTAPTRQVQCTDTGVTVTYSFSNAILQSDPLFDGCSMLKIDGFGMNYVPEEPAVLFRSDMFALPIGASATLSLGDCEFTEFSCQLSPSRQPLTNGTYTCHTRDNVLPIKPYSGLFPTEIASMSAPQCYRGTPLQRVQISPVQYDYERRIVRVYTKLQYILSYDFSSPQKLRGNNANTPAYISPSDNFISNLTLNSTSLPASGPARAPVTEQNDTKDYLIITTPDYKGAAQTLSEWKKLLGFRTHIIARNDWTPDTIKSEVRKFYASHPALYYLLIIGKQNAVPAMDTIHTNGWQGAPNVRFVSDFYYSCLDGSDDTMPDIACGRLIMSSPGEADIIVKKIISYEQSPVTDPSFYNTALSCAYFQDDDYDGYADCRFAHTAEEISYYLSHYHNKTVNRVYYTEPDVIPTHWNKGVYSSGEAIPQHLLKPTFAWNGSAADIKNHIINGTFLVLQSDHGTVFGWSEPSFSSNNLIGLNNTNKLPVIFSISCLTGKFNTKDICFAEKILSSVSGGCVGIFAATEVGYVGVNDAMVCGMFDAIWPSPGLRPKIFGHIGTSGTISEPTYALGQILNQGKIRMGDLFNHESRTNGIKEHVRDVFHCFGDPSMQLYTQTPTPFQDVSVTRDSYGIHVSVPFDNARITFSDTKTGNVYSTVSNAASYSTQTPYDVDVCVSGHNKIPYVEYGTIYIQREEIVGSREYNAGKIFIGSNVTSSIGAGEAVFRRGKFYLRANEITITPDTKMYFRDSITIDPQ